MIVQSIHFTFAPQDADKAEAILRRLRDASREEEGMIGFDVARGQEKTNVFTRWEEYRDKAAIDAHIASDHFKRLVIDGARALAQKREGETFVQPAQTLRFQFSRTLRNSDGYTMNRRNGSIKAI